MASSADYTYELESFALQLEPSGVTGSGRLRLRGTNPAGADPQAPSKMILSLRGPAEPMLDDEGSRLRRSIRRLHRGHENAVLRQVRVHGVWLAVHYDDEDPWVSLVWAVQPDFPERLAGFLQRGARLSVSFGLLDPPSLLDDDAILKLLGHGPDGYLEGGFADLPVLPEEERRQLGLPTMVHGLRWIRFDLRVLDPPAADPATP